MPKVEAVSILDAPNYRDLISKTMSCAQRYFRYTLGSSKQCGICLPCIIRRAAIKYADLEDNDTTYIYDVENFESLTNDGKTIVYELRDFCHKLSLCKNDMDVLLKYPQFMMENADVSKLIALYGRYVSEVSNLVE